MVTADQDQDRWHPEMHPDLSGKRHLTGQTVETCVDGHNRGAKHHDRTTGTKQDEVADSKTPSMVATDERVEVAAEMDQHLT